MYQIVAGPHILWCDRLKPVAGVTVKCRITGKLRDVSTWDLERRVGWARDVCPFMLGMTTAEFQKMVDDCKEIEATPVAPLSAEAQKKEQLRILLRKVAPLCPECGKKMTHVTDDMESQGGPPENSWLCTTPMCGRVLYS